MSATILPFRPAARRVPQPYVVAEGALHVELYHCVLVPDEITFGEIARALTGSGLVLSTDPASGCQTIHRNLKEPA